MNDFDFVDFVLEQKEKLRLPMRVILLQIIDTAYDMLIDTPLGELNE